jgi:hypothetical protein
VALIVGQSMLRTDDGMKGLVVMSEGDIPRIVYLDRGEQRFAGKGEKWEPAREPPRKMRREEMLHIARFADSALRAAELHEPHKWWILEQPTYDQDLVELIVHYLEQRK